MENRFEGIFSFHHIGGELPPAAEVLKECLWDIDHHNAPYLAGKTAEPSHGLVELTTDQAFENATRVKLSREWSEADMFVVVGDISHALIPGSDVIVARTSDFKQAGELAGKMGYRPALAGEFLQLLRWLPESSQRYYGWFYCYAGRKPGYAILAEYHSYPRSFWLRVIFDTRIGEQVEEGHVSANADTYCFFVRSH